MVLGLLLWAMAATCVACMAISIASAFRASAAHFFGVDSSTWGTSTRAGMAGVLAALCCMTMSQALYSVGVPSSEKLRSD